MPWACFRRASPIRPSANAKRARRRSAIWEEQGLPFAQDHPQPVRVIRTREQVTQTHYQRDATSANHLPGMVLDHHLACPSLLRSPGSSPGPCPLESGKQRRERCHPKLGLEKWIPACFLTSSPAALGFLVLPRLSPTEAWRPSPWCCAWPSSSPRLSPCGTPKLSVVIR